MSERARINWVQVSAAALAAVSSAVVLSTLGVAGTLIGAALGSVTASLGSTIYTRGIDLSKRQVAAQAAALRRVTNARADLDEASAAAESGDPAARARLHSAADELDEAEHALHEASGPEGADDTPLEAAGGTPLGEELAEQRARRELSLKQLPWKRIAVLAAVVFLRAMGVITAFEVVSGRAVSAYTGGSNADTRTTFSGVAKDTGGSKPSKTPSDTPTDEATTETSEPTEATESTAPTEESTPTSSVTGTMEPTPTETEPSTELPTETPVITPTPIPTPTDAATPE